MQIAICDDESLFINSVITYIKKWSEENSYTDVNYNVFTSAEQLLYSIKDEAEYDLYFLDLMLPKMNGFELAKRIRYENEDATIVFITSNDGFMEIGYEVALYRYLRKPLYYEKIKGCLDYAYAQSRIKGKSILVKSEGYNKKILLKNITYFSAGIHSIFVHTISGEIYKIIYKGSVDSFLAEHCTQSFVRCHRGHIVNMQYVDRFTSTMIYLYNDPVEIPIGRSFHDATIDKLRAFFDNSLG